MARGDHRGTGGKGLEHNQERGVAPGRDHGQIGAGEEPGAIDPSGEVDAFGQAQALGPSTPGGAAKRTRGDQGPGQLGAARKRGEELGQSLSGRVVPDERDQRSLGGTRLHAQLRAHDTSRALGQGSIAFQVHTVGHDLQPLGAAGMEAQELRANGVGHADHAPRTVVCEQALLEVPKDRVMASAALRGDAPPHAGLVLALQAAVMRPVEVDLGQVADADRDVRFRAPGKLDQGMTQASFALRAGPPAGPRAVPPPG